MGVKLTLSEYYTLKDLEYERKHLENSPSLNEVLTKRPNFAELLKKYEELPEFRLLLLKKFTNLERNIKEHYKQKKPPIDSKTEKEALDGAIDDFECCYKEHYDFFMKYKDVEEKSESFFTKMLLLVDRLFNEEVGHILSKSLAKKMWVEYKVPDTIRYLNKYWNLITNSKYSLEFFDFIETKLLFTHDEPYLERLIKFLESKEINSFNDAMECASMKISDNSVVCKVAPGGWSDVYKMISEKMIKEGRKVYKILKVPRRHLFGVSNDKVLEKFGSLEKMIEEEEMIAEILNNRNGLKYGNNFNYLPLPTFRQSIDVEILSGFVEYSPQDDLKFRVKETKKAIVYEYIEGKNLKQIIEENPNGLVVALGTKEYLEIFSKAAYALNFVHMNFGPHNDVKPDNFIYSKDGFVYILDLAFARLTDPQSSGLKGVRAYTAPERVLGGAPPSIQADIYSFGAMMYEAYTGRRPIEFGDTEEEKQAVAKKVHEGEIKPKLDIKLHIDRNFMMSVRANLFTHSNSCLIDHNVPAVVHYNVPAVIMNCLEFNVEQRYRSMQEVENHLLREYEKQISSCGIEMVQSTKPPRNKDPSYRRFS